MSRRLSSEEQEKLVLENLRLVHYMVNKLGIAPGDYDDIVSVGTMGLIKAASTFDMSKGWKFATYASKCINNEIFMHFRKTNKHVNMISLEEPVFTEKDGKEISLDDMLSSTEVDFREEIEERDFAERFINIILNLLDPRERLIMLYKIAGMNQIFIGETINISQSYISRLEKNLKNKLKEYLNNSEKYKEVFSMSVVGNSYKISFFSKDVKDFNKIFATLLQNLTSAETLPNFRVVCNKERIVISVPAHPESFSFIAQIIQEIDDYSVTFVSEKVEVHNDEIGSQVARTEESEASSKTEDITVEASDIESAEEISRVERNQIISDNLSSSTEGDKVPLPEISSDMRRGILLKQVKEYMLSRDTFTVSELKAQFPNVPTATINNALTSAKAKGLISVIARGQYATIKVVSEEGDKTPLPENSSTVERGTLLSQIREYMLIRDTFTVKELKEKFPNAPTATINNALTSAKAKGLISLITRGQYVTKKD